MNSTNDPLPPEYAALARRPGNSAKEALARAEKALTTSYAKQEAMKMALSLLLQRYVTLAASGDCGNWDPETEAEVILARKVLTP